MRAVAVFAMLLVVLGGSSLGLPGVACAADKPLVVCLLEGTLGDKGPNDALKDALAQVERELPVRVKLVASAYADTLDQAFTDALADRDKPPLLLMAAGAGPHTLLMNYAGNYRTQLFAAFDGYIPFANIASLLFYEAQGAYLAGVAAAVGADEAARRGKPGGVACLTDRDSWANTTMGKAFALGAGSVDATLSVSSSHSGSTSDDAAARTAADRALSTGAASLFIASGKAGLAALTTVERAGGFAVGYGQDQATIAPRAVLCSYRKNMLLAVRTCVQKALDGSLKGRDFLSMTVENGGVDMPLNPKLPPELHARLEAALAAARERLHAGVPDLPPAHPPKGCNCR